MPIPELVMGRAYCFNCQGLRKKWRKSTCTWADCPVCKGTGEPQVAKVVKKDEKK